MRRFNSETAIAVIELQQMLADFGHAMDRRSPDVADYYCEDGAFLLGTVVHRGREAIRAFYAAHAERIRTTERDGQRQALHAFVNVRVTIEDSSHATLDFFNINYSASGARPVIGPVVANMIVECRMACRREEDGAWRIVEFGGTPQFTAGDAFVDRLAARN